jgi:hypothetical protein
VDEKILFNYDSIRFGEIGSDYFNGYPAQIDNFNWLPNADNRDYDDPINTNTFQVKLSSCVYDESLGYKMGGCLNSDMLTVRVKSISDESFTANQAILDGSITM